MYITHHHPLYSPFQAHQRHTVSLPCPSPPKIIRRETGTRSSISLRLREFFFFFSSSCFSSPSILILHLPIFINSSIVIFHLFVSYHFILPSYIPNNHSRYSNLISYLNIFHSFTSFIFILHRLYISASPSYICFNRLITCPSSALNLIQHHLDSINTTFPTAFDQAAAWPHPAVSSLENSPPHPETSMMQNPWVHPLPQQVPMYLSSHQNPPYMYGGSPQSQPNSVRNSVLFSNVPWLMIV